MVNVPSLLMVKVRAYVFEELFCVGGAFPTVVVLLVLILAPSKVSADTIVVVVPPLLETTVVDLSNAEIFHIPVSLDVLDLREIEGSSGPFLKHEDNGRIISITNPQ